MNRTIESKEKGAAFSDPFMGTQVTENIWHCPDGIYRWYYEFDMLKNPTILITVLKVMGISAAAVLIFVFLIALFSGDVLVPDAGSIRIFVYVLLFFILLVLLSYGIVAWKYGWKYIVLFEMDEKKVAHIQLPKQYEAAQALGWLTALAGGAAGNITAAGIGMNILNKDRSVSEYTKVKKIKGVKHRHVIYVNEGLEHNQVYADDADYDFVMDFLASHCPGARVSG